MKSERSILVTDSGLGGVSVFNRIAARLENGSPWQKVNLIYFNAWPAPLRGYNHFDTLERRVRVFDNAMTAMNRFDPDEIYIACNTLSVIYPHTPFAKKGEKKVEGIVDYGVQMLFQHLSDNPESIAVIFGTPSTAEAGSHRKGLNALGIPDERILSIGCTDLAGYIEREPFSDKVGKAIDHYVREAARQFGNGVKQVYAALCCTHFGYRQTLFEKAFAEVTQCPVTLLNPNIPMADSVFEDMDADSVEGADIRVKMVSQAVWNEKQIEAYIELMPDMTPAVREALTGYEQSDTLFSVA